ncbi:cAMP-binding domain of CRP or a regulatory subunit of cAMP-dependent protein kinases [Butyrivibrio sp. INlla18]|uniref:Crp/Fnr family transcriptional regulator n=1 Tax=Butyrivibrio sp. INlla18 TaxID=1520806 RepID=UPI00088FCCC3|nr:Crp/Fnr family transcriptional regulator [Butyrivibrio sp. INlla18]SDA63352.1 cAMP-binding domain of CRP or a regulatory subunit of cAMP-dependent protein kinases [Butyrivibrio sp. INlla18]
MNLEGIEKSRLFKEMTAKELSSCLASLDAREKKYRKDDLILRAGERTSSIGMVLSGSVTIESNDVWGNCSVLSHVGQNQFFAETYALLGEVLLVDVRANEDCRILFCNIRNLLEDSKKSSPWKEKLLKNILIISSQKNLVLSGRSFHTSPKSCRGRLLSYLNAIALQTSSREFDIPFNRQQLADYLNLERTNMSKELSHMKDEGLIEYRKSHFKLIKAD